MQNKMLDPYVIPPRKPNHASSLQKGVFMSNSFKMKELLDQWSIFENTPIEFALLNIHTGAILKSNRAWNLSLGSTNEEMEGKHFEGIVALKNFSFESFRATCVKDGLIMGLKLMLYKEDGDVIEVLLSAGASDEYIRCTFLNITKQRLLTEERAQMIIDLGQALKKIQALQSFISICASCKKIRDDKGTWIPFEEYFNKNSLIEFTRGICQDCAKRIYSGVTKV